MLPLGNGGLRDEDRDPVPRRSRSPHEERSPLTGPALVALCAAACASLLVSERRGSRLGVWLSKPLAAVAFVALGLALGGLESDYGRWVVLALLLSLLGDVLLIPDGRELWFLCGIGSFLCAHVAYCVAFAVAGVSAPALAAGGAAVLPLAWVVLRWLGPRLRGFFRVAVPLYVAVIATMVAFSSSATHATGHVLPVLGAVLFAVSDVAVARARFVSPGFVNAAWGLPLYFAAQVLLALSVARVPGADGG
jgi:uncharacterized membrane protein YhhN